MTLHPLAAQFAGVADAYERGRPEYAPPWSARSRANSRRAGRRVLDLAAGTGKLTRALVHAGLDVVAVERRRPCGAAGRGRRRRARERGHRRVHPDRGPLRAGGHRRGRVPLVDPVRALAEIRRVLEPGAALRCSPPVTTGARRRGRTMSASCCRAEPEHPHFDGPPWQTRCAPPRLERAARDPCSHRCPGDAGDLRGLPRVAELDRRPPRGRPRALLDRARAIITAGHTPREMRVSVVIGVSRLA